MAFARGSEGIRTLRAEIPKSLDSSAFCTLGEIHTSLFVLEPPDLEGPPSQGPKEQNWQMQQTADFLLPLALEGKAQPFCLSDLG